MRFISGLFIALFILTACQKDKIGKEGEGHLLLKVNFNTKTNPVIAVRSSSKPISVIIKDANGKEVRTYREGEELPEDISLNPGTYTAEVTSGNNPDAAFSDPYFYGEKEFTVKADETVQTMVECTLANAKVSVNYSDRIKQYFSSYQTTVSVPRGSLTYTEQNTEDGYFKIGRDSIQLSWQLNVSNTSGQLFSQSGSFYAKKRQHYSLNFDIQDKEETEEGGLKVNIIANDDIVHRDTSVIIVLRTLPEITGEGFDITEPVALQYQQYEGSYKVNIKGTPAIQAIQFKHNCNYMLTNGIPSQFPLLNLSAEGIQTLKNAGLEWNMFTDSTASLDFTDLLPKLETGSFEFTFEVSDSKGKNNTATIQLAIIDADVLTLSLNSGTSEDLWARRARIGGKWITGQQPDGLQMRYRKQGSTDWTTVDATDIIANKAQFYAVIKNLEPETTYEYQASSIKSGTIASANTLTFTTEAAMPLPNSSFDEWDGTYPWAAGSNDNDKFWDTGNKAAEIAKLVLTRSSDILPSGISKGKSAYLQSQYTKAFGIADVFAAGNIFSGKFGQIEGTSGASMTFGQPYTSRPQKLKGYYRYMSKTIDWDKKGGMKGKEDRFHIYIILADQAHYLNTTDQSTLFDMDKIKRGEDSHTIAFAELTSEKFDEDGNDITPPLTMNDYKAFEIELTYYKKNVKPSYIIVAASSSKYGDYYTGGIGSELYIDEFELVFE